MESDQVLSARMSDCSANGDDNSSVVMIYGQYGTHKGTPEFRRIIASVRDSSGKLLPKAIFQYYSVCGEKIPVEISRHGNASRTF